MKRLVVFLLVFARLYVSFPSAAGTHSKYPDGFSCNEIPDSVFVLMQGASYKADCPVPLRELRYLRILHRDCEGKILKGEMVVNRAIADDVLEIFHELFLAGYPIEKVELVDKYGGNDDNSMRANNSSSFNFRYIAHTKTVSKHGLGMAVDINPLYNPYYRKTQEGEYVEPENARPYLDRAADFHYKIAPDDLCVRLFKEHGFTWGGDWKSCKDYQHFEK